jgi:SAM-dependent methyltransferase
MMKKVDDITESYADLPFHKEIGKVIETHSENKRDIRDVARSLMDWTEIHRVLDLGCGYGWFEQNLPSPLDLLCGIDCLAENRAEFLKVGKRVAKKALFKTMRLPAPVDMDTGSFDLVAAAYSLYFFPDMVAEVRRLLRQEGAFVVITHSESMLEEGEKFFDFKNLRMVIRGFSAENGAEILARHFEDIQFVDFENALVFKREDAESLDKYILFKRAFISRDVDPELVRKKLLYELNLRGEIRLSKRDRIFLVRK